MSTTCTLMEQNKPYTHSQISPLHEHICVQKFALPCQIISLFFNLSTNKNKFPPIPVSLHCFNIIVSYIFFIILILITWTFTICSTFFFFFVFWLIFLYILRFPKSINIIYIIEKQILKRQNETRHLMYYVLEMFLHCHW